jgi:hypothetical protein
MPATAARCGRAPANRRAASDTSAGVRTLTTTAWARAALDDHRGGQAVVRRVGSPPASGPPASAPVPAAGSASGSPITIPACVYRDRGFGADLARRPAQGARPRGRSRPACGRAAAPETIATCDGATPAHRVTARITAAFARPPAGGSRTRSWERRAVPRCQRRSVRAPGWTRTASRVRPLTGGRPRRVAGCGTSSTIALG